MTEGNSDQLWIPMPSRRCIFPVIAFYTISSQKFEFHMVLDLYCGKNSHLG